MQIESAFPTIGRPIMSLNGDEDAVVGALKQSLVSYRSVSLCLFLSPLVIMLETFDYADMVVVLK
jgi:hypothetical protein